MRRSELAAGLTRFSEESNPRGRGRRSGLTDPQLHNRRDQLVQIFESTWAEIYRELQRCKKADGLVAALAPLTDPRSWVRNATILFCQQSSEPGSGITLRKVRAEMRALIPLLLSADQSKRQAEEKLHQVNWALDQAHGRNRRMVMRARKKRRKEAWRTARHYQTLSAKERKLRERVAGLETSFARQELFDFLSSQRYALTPLNLANAVAGLPHMGWRQSMRRTFKASCAIANGNSYQVFKAISYIASNANKRAENSFVTSFRDGVSSLPTRYRVPKAELADTWFYLERAIRQAFRSRPQPRAVVCEITKRYFKQIRAASQVDTVLAEQAKLTLSKQPKTSHDGTMKAST
jgi:hypothetical protein